MMLRSVLLAAAVAMPASLSAATMTFLPVADGNGQRDISAPGGARVVADGPRVAIDARDGMGSTPFFLEYDLGTVMAGARLSSASLTLSNVSAGVELFFESDALLFEADVYEGDGVVDEDDFFASAREITLSSLALEPVDGDPLDGAPTCSTCVLEIGNLDAIKDLLATGRLALVARIDEDLVVASSFLAFDSIESSTGPGAVLTLDFATIPVPASGIMLLSALGAAAAFRRRR